MPFTPFHYPIVYLIYRINKRFSLPGLIVGSLISDVEIPFMVLFFGIQVPNRMIFHSLFGAITIGTFLGVIITVRVYPYLVNRFFDIDKKKVEDKCRFSPILVLSVSIGSISHVLLDVLNHPYNPIFWPFRSTIETLSPIYFAFGDPLGSLWLQVVMGILLIGLILVKQKNLYEELLVG